METTFCYTINFIIFMYMWHMHMRHVYMHYNYYHIVYIICMCVKIVMSIWKFPVITNYNPHFTLNHPLASFHKNSAHVKCLYIASSLAPNGKGYTPWNQQQKALKIDGWNILLGSLFSVAFAVSFWEGTDHHLRPLLPGCGQSGCQRGLWWDKGDEVRLLRPSCNNR